jgi:predicted RND superfamily exporter protein
VWFFFVQSPMLLASLGREAFVPLQMRMTITFFRAVSVATVALVGLAVADTASVTSWPVITAGVGLLGAGVNQLVVVPRALRAGGRSRRDIAGKDHEGSTAQFASEGAGSRTKTLHRLVVLFVVVMLAGVVLHGLTLLGAHAVS